MERRNVEGGWSRCGWQNPKVQNPCNILRDNEKIRLWLERMRKFVICELHLNKVVTKMNYFRGETSTNLPKRTNSTDLRWAQADGWSEAVKFNLRQFCFQRLLTVKTLLYIYSQSLVSRPISPKQMPPNNWNLWFKTAQSHDLLWDLEFCQF